MKKIAKIISDRGYCSRREAEKLIISGKVIVNDVIVTNVAERFDESVKIIIDNKMLQKNNKTVVFLFNKPTGCISSTKDERNRTTIFDYIPKNLPRLVSVGRLDYNSQGLMILTNNGELAKELMSPNNKIQRTYLVKVFGKIPENMIHEIESGITIDGIKYGKSKIHIKSLTDKKHLLEITLFEGKNREIRKICEYFNLSVNSLKRISYENFSLSNIPPKCVREVDPKIVNNLLKKYLKRSEEC